MSSIDQRTFEDFLQSPDLWFQSPSGTLHSKCVLFAFLGNKSYGQKHFISGTSHQLKYQRSGWCLFCSQCGEIWARLVIKDPTTTAVSFHVVDSPCEKHKYFDDVPGSLLPIGNDLLQMLPREALAREFHLHLAYRQE